jgi:type IV pilus assembly protein PilC
MAEFSYIAITKEGKERKGKMEAGDETKVRVTLRGEGLIPINVTELNLLNKDINITVGNPVKVRELSVFCRQFQSILNAGVTIVNALDMLTAQTENKVFKTAIKETKQSVERGETLADAMRKSPKIFPPLLVNMVEAGEASGSLDKALGRTALQFEKTAKLKALMKKAMIYPVMLLLVATAVLIIMSVVVVPQFAKMFTEMGSDLPAITKFVMRISDIIRFRWYIIALIILFFVVGVRALQTMEEGKLIIGKLKIRMPILGRLHVKSSSASFARTLSTLISSGISVTKALEITSRSMSNVLFQRALEKTKEEAERGVSLSTPIAASNLFPPMVSQMLRIGEETGNIEGMLDKVAEYYEDEVEIATQSLSASLEPIIIIVMAVIIGVIVMAIYMPMVSMYQGLDNL